MFHYFCQSHVLDNRTTLYLMIYKNTKVICCSYTIHAWYSAQCFMFVMLSSFLNIVNNCIVCVHTHSLISVQSMFFTCHYIPNKLAASWPFCKELMPAFLGFPLKHNDSLIGTRSSHLESTLKVINVERTLRYLQGLQCVLWDYPLLWDTGNTKLSHSFHQSWTIFI